jgi:hypothetical protein
MATENNTAQPPDDQEQASRKAENNPFSEQEKHGPNADRRSPSNAEEYRGDPSVQRRAPGIEDVAGEDERRSS